MKRLLFIFGFLGVTGCGINKTAQVPLQMDYDDGLKKIIANGKQTTARVWYTYDGLKPTIEVQPKQSVPTIIQFGDATDPDWATAVQEGLPIDDGHVVLTGLPLDQRATEIVIEFLQDINGKQFVVGFLCIKGPGNTGYSEAQLKADLSQPLIATRGRTCGSCSQPTNPEDLSKTCLPLGANSLPSGVTITPGSGSSGGNTGNKDPNKDLINGTSGGSSGDSNNKSLF